MSIKITVSEELFKAIQKDAVPFKDHEPADVLIRWATQLGKLIEKKICTPQRPLSYINKRLEKFFFNNKEFNARSWADLQVIVCEELYKLYPNSFHKCKRLFGRNMKYFSDQSAELKSPKPISDSGYYVETYLNNHYKITRLKELMHLLGHDKNDLIIIVKE